MQLAALSVYRGGRSLSAISDSKLPRNEFWVLNYFGTRANFNGTANFQEWLGSIPIDWIVTWTRLGDTTVREAIKSLVADGYLESRTVFATDGQQLGNDYRITSRIFNEYAERLAERLPGRQILFEKTKPRLSIVPVDAPSEEVPPPGDLDAPAWSDPEGGAAAVGGVPAGGTTIPEPYTRDEKPITSTLPPRACVRVDPPFTGRLTPAELLVQEIFRETDWRYKNQALRAAAAEAQHKHGLEALERFRDAVVKEGDDGRLGFHRSTFIKAVASEAAKLAAPPEQRFVW